MSDTRVESKSPPKPVEFAGKSKKISVNVDEGRGSLRASDDRLASKKRVSGKRMLSIDPSTKHEGKHTCSATIYVHMWIDPDKTNCTPDRIQAWVDAAESGLENQWRNSNCPCPDGHQGRGCTFSVKIIWHETAKSGDVLPVVVDCSAWAETSDEGMRTGDVDKGGPVRRGDSGATIAHELGHVLFGSGKDTPLSDKKSKESGKVAWDEHGHNPDSEGLMRDTSVHGGMKQEDKPTSEEVCILVDKYHLCGLKFVQDCCEPRSVQPEKRSPLPVPRDRSRNDSRSMILFEFFRNSSAVVELSSYDSPGRGVRIA